jgi:hypothetical protein
VSKRRALFALLAALPVAAASFACTADSEDISSGTGDTSDPFADELKNVEKNGKPSPQWVYSGMMPSLEKPSVVVSLSAHTVRVTGLVPKSFTGKLPFYANLGAMVNGQQQVFLVYPVATGKIDPITGKQPVGPGDYDGLRISPYVPSAENPWGGFPFMAYNRARGLAFHGPITSVAGGDDPGDFEWRLIRGQVSHGCQRMQGEHVVEMAHLLGVDMTKLHKSSEVINNTSFNVHVSFDIDKSPEGKLVDVDYPALDSVKRPTGADAKIYKTWDSRDFPNFVCAYNPARPIIANYCEAAGKPLRDALTGARLPADTSGPFIGTACKADSDCGFKVGATAATCKKTAAGGYCTVSCAGSCADKYGYAPTFCAKDGAGGSCAAKSAEFNGNCSKIPGTTGALVDRYIGTSTASAAQATVCALK